MRPKAKEKCDRAWSDRDDQDLCYRVAMAGESLGRLLAAVKNQPEPNFDLSDSKIASRTDHDHPAAQCRLDTYLRGATCTKTFDEKVIPGRNHAQGQQSRGAEEVALRYSCAAGGTQDFASRPTCWFKPKATQALAL